MFFSLEISVLTLVLLAVGLLAGLTYALWQCLRAARLQRFIDHDEQEREYVEQLPPVSIIVDACTETGQLPRFLPLVLAQEYPEFEVVVVANTEAEATSDALSTLKVEFPNLHITFAPRGTRTLSRKKLAIMLGIKASQHDVILTTNANCQVHSERWLMAMMRNFGPGVDVVLGYSHFSHDNDKGLGRTYRIYDEMTSSIQWLLSAIKGKPYRGISDNLAYRKSLFYEHKGFSKSLELKWGDDDIFISEIATARNTRLEMLPASYTTAHYDDLPHAFSTLKSRRDFTSRHVNTRAPMRAQAWMSLLYWLRLAAIVAAIVLAWNNLAVLCAAALILLITWLPMMLTTFRNCYLLKLPLLLFSAPLMTVVRPIVSIAYQAKGLFTRKNNYTTII